MNELFDAPITKYYINRKDKCIRFMFSVDYNLYSDISLINLANYLTLGRKRLYDDPYNDILVNNVKIMENAHEEYHKDFTPFFYGGNLQSE